MGNECRYWYLPALAPHGRAVVHACNSSPTQAHKRLQRQRPQAQG